ncbi:hypothetical protein H8B09_06895 [Paenibacillus sp. PR3]|uniref:Uncharacterized protein n=1 Tax=Paenibacillus terricola TaxID=2763503 RepID=A0ABR8MR54_9BACL|nr:DUF5995 family protein [Paenibacillus terricola]MBD3918476.1 hypothetical protein [Paenibacillus terricola]
MMAAMSTGSMSNARTIDEVLDRLDSIIQSSIERGSRIGYFAAMYRMVTAQVKEGILNGRFEDGPRMERFDVRFANRFLDAYDAYSRKDKCSLCWRIAFDAAQRQEPLVLQHLLLGMNAHINYDLGIAAAETCPGAALEPLHHDFNEINDILASLIDEVKGDLAAVSPWIGWLDRLGGRATDVIIRFSMKKARSFAWHFAVSLSQADSVDRFKLTMNRDAETTLLGQELLKPPGWLLRSVIWLIRTRETSSIADITRHLLAKSVTAATIPPQSGTVSV